MAAVAAALVEWPQHPRAREVARVPNRLSSTLQPPQIGLLLVPLRVEPPSCVKWFLRFSLVAGKLLHGSRWRQKLLAAGRGSHVRCALHVAAAAGCRLPLSAVAPRLQL